MNFHLSQKCLYSFGVGIPHIILSIMRSESLFK